MTQPYVERAKTADAIVESYRKLFRYPKLFNFKDFNALRKHLLDLYKNTDNVESFVASKMKKLETKLYKHWMQQQDSAEDEVLYIKRRDTYMHNQKILAEERAFMSALKHTHQQTKKTDPQYINRTLMTLEEFG